jgi:hypothetical protein
MRSEAIRQVNQEPRGLFRLRLADPRNDPEVIGVCIKRKRAQLSAEPFN